LISYYNDVFPFTHKSSEAVFHKSRRSYLRTAKEAMAVLETQPGAEFGAGTWWQALNSVTYLDRPQNGSFSPILVWNLLGLVLIKLAK
jgi:hypothetical protein